MEKQLSVTYPASLADSLKLGDREFESEIKILSLIKLYELGKVSSGTAARVLGISRVDFLEKAGEYQVSVFQLPDESSLDEDITNA